MFDMPNFYMAYQKNKRNAMSVIRNSKKLLFNLSIIEKEIAKYEQKLKEKQKKKAHKRAS